MEQSKKAIGFFFGLAILAFGFLLFYTKQIEPFSDFALIEWQIKLANQGIFHLPYQNHLEDPNFHFFPFPSLFFHIQNGSAYSTFPNLYPILFSPLYASFGLIGIKVAQFVLFFFSIYLFYQINKNAISAILLLSGSTIFIYIFLIHETILFFFLEILILYLYHNRRTGLSGFLALCLVWMRPEMIFAVAFLPFCFSEKHNWKRYWFVFLITGIVFSIVNQFTFGTFVPIRFFKKPEYQFRPEIAFYLFKITLEQIPIIFLFIIYLVKSFKRKEWFYRNISLLTITTIIILISPNTGGHNTPRYLFGLIPLYILLLRTNTNIENKISKRWILLCLALSIYSLVTLWNQTKELKKISKFQTNTLEELTKIEDQILVFNNSDFAFVALPLLDRKKNLLLLQNQNHRENLITILNAKNASSFTFLELPPSPIPIGETLKLPGCNINCEFRTIETKTLPNALLPIKATRYKRM
ncbi:hypothetical protein EHQ16_09050 [Leptospira kanakyensis]|uniref:Glycosyltransferase RgtA/B/C/D-like domain-containing protein n=1 Tax=Leptospira kanakyensis TaxID=2484968 RepID=A0A6N4Q9G2_9LEPT|nr:hypothetical protein [Leptospira kanakyensis]TGK55497.1 hypothetical protein EHQ11_01225 [Leptospira kanakyensis]TGK61031.1 hypothetical protein EHQ16_09050 [Leptospira kanakyensis]TGK76496.1 hypothetical protein EHQ18_00600 [Leptospira kanakyensis]